MDRALRLGLELPFPPGPAGGAECWTAAAAAAEGAGFASLWTAGSPDPCTLAGGLVPHTATAVLGVVSGVGDADRNPSVLARDLTGLDVVSEGRAAVLLVAEDGDRLTEAVTVCRLLFTEESPDFTGHHFLLRAAADRPRPVRPGGPLVLAQPSADQVAVRPTAPVDGWVVGGGPESVARWRSVVEGPALVWRGTLPPGDAAVEPAAALARAGADGLIVQVGGSVDAVTSTGRALGARWAA
jgi:alkanesulfonate monooxygenase SsuD/methylene tetrahydromethanopterin reductase-like flavin-dependent oxidoreductase (luciferase family)